MQPPRRRPGPSRPCRARWCALALTPRKPTPPVLPFMRLQPDAMPLVEEILATARSWIAVHASDRVGFYSAVEDLRQEPKQAKAKEAKAKRVTTAFLSEQLGAFQVRPRLTARQAGPFFAGQGCSAIGGPFCQRGASRKIASPCRRPLPCNASSHTPADPSLVYPREPPDLSTRRAVRPGLREWSSNEKNCRRPWRTVPYLQQGAHRRMHPSSPLPASLADMQGEMSMSAPRKVWGICRAEGGRLNHVVPGPHLRLPLGGRRGWGPGVHGLDSDVVRGSPCQFHSRGALQTLGRARLPR